MAALIASATACLSFENRLRVSAAEKKRASDAFLEAAMKKVHFEWTDVDCGRDGVQGRALGEPILQGFIPATGQPITVKLTNYGMGGPWHMRLFPEDSGGGSGGGGGRGGGGGGRGASGVHVL